MNPGSSSLNLHVALESLGVRKAQALSSEGFDYFMKSVHPSHFASSVTRTCGAPPSRNRVGKVGGAKMTIHGRIPGVHETSRERNRSVQCPVSAVNLWRGPGRAPKSLSDAR